MKNKVEEFVDLVDSAGDIKIKKILRSEINNYPGLYMQIIIGVVFNEKGEILVHKRALNKKVNPGDIDHVCGGMVSGESLEEAFVRESVEETGVKPVDIKIIDKGVNKYNRFRYLLAGRSNEKPKTTKDAEWSAYIGFDILKVKRGLGEFNFVDEFFEETEKVIGKYKL